MDTATSQAEAFRRLTAGHRGPLAVVAPLPAECLWPIEETVFLPTDARNKLEALAQSQGKSEVAVAQQLLVDALSRVTILDSRRRVA